MNRGVVFFYSGTLRNFKDVLCGYLYEICRDWDVVLLTERMDRSAEQFIGDRFLFPNIMEVVGVEQHEPRKGFWGEVRKYRRLKRLADSLYRKYKPEFVIAPSDNFPFELFLMRRGRNNGAMNVSIQTSFFEDVRMSIRYVDCLNMYLKFPGWLPAFVKRTCVIVRKYFGHLLYYWVFPMISGEFPFIGRSSFVLYKIDSGMRDSHFHVAMSEQQRIVHEKDGVPSGKLVVFPHPCTRSARKVYEEMGCYAKGRRFDSHGAASQKRALVLFPASPVGFGKDMFPIDEGKYMGGCIEAVAMICEHLKGWHVSLKEHPVADYSERLSLMLSGLGSVEHIDKRENLYEHVAKADVVFEFAKGGGTALYFSHLMYPGKKLVSVDLYREFLGDTFKSIGGVDYIDSMDAFREVLRELKTGNSPRAAAPEEPVKTPYGTAGDLLRFLKERRCAGG